MIEDEETIDSIQCFLLFTVTSDPNFKQQFYQPNNYYYFFNNVL